MLILLPPSDRRALSAVGTAIGVAVLAGYLSGALGIFGGTAMWTGVILLAAFGLSRAFTARLRFSRELLGVAALSLGWALCLSAFSSPSVFSGRDQGAYAGAALKLADSGAFTWREPAAQAFFQVYGRGQALNFPGFFYTDQGLLTSQFPLGSIVWSALWADLFGLDGLVVANTAALVLALVFFYALLRFFTPVRLAAASTAILAFSFPLTWFPKYSLSENFALPLFMMLAFSVVAAYRGGRGAAFTLGWTAGALLMLTRIEGLLILPIALFLFFRSPAGAALLRKRPFAGWWFPAFGTFLLFILSLSTSLPFYRTVVKALAKSFDPSETMGGSLLGVAETFHLFPVLNLYALLFPILVAVLSVAVLLKRGPRAALIPILLALPLLWYFLNPHISDDHPWMLRRFLFALWPALFLLVPIALALVGQRLTTKFPAARWPRFYAAAFLLYIFLTELPLLFLFAFRSEHRALWPETERLAERFSGRDLILVSREASGDPFAMLPGALSAQGLQAVYFFNPDDLMRLDRSAFENTYLIVSDGEYARYAAALSDQLERLDTYVLETSRLKPETDTHLPVWENLSTMGAIYRLY